MGFVYVVNKLKYPLFIILSCLLCLMKKALSVDHLRNAITRVNIPAAKQQVGSRFAVSFVLASLVTAANWVIQKQFAEAENNRANQIIKRVSEKKTVDLEDLSDCTRVNDLEGSLVKVKGELLEGRFIVKRSRGGHEGYIVLAPFAVKRIQQLKDLSQKSMREKYMLNLGWIPKESKHTIRQTAADDILEFDELPDELASEEDAPATSTFTAYVRKGEEQDILRGYRNFDEDKLYKFIDLPLLHQVFSSLNKSSKYIYLDRADEEGTGSYFPFPNTQEIYIDQLKQDIAYNNKRKEQLTKGVGVASFASALLVSLL